MKTNGKQSAKHRASEGESTRSSSDLKFPCNPLERFTVTDDDRRRLIRGILESYNSNYDVLIESLQNSMDAIEDASLSGLPGPYLIHVTVNLAENWIGVLDSGVGMSRDRVVRAFVPSASFKDDPALTAKRGAQWAYRGYKGVGLTFLAYGTDDIILHSKSDGVLTKVRMQYGRAWAEGTRPDPALITEHSQPSPIEKLDHGTYIQLQFSSNTRPKSLSRLSATNQGWLAVLRTRTAVGQVLLNRKEITPIQVKLTVIDAEGRQHHYDAEPAFLFPHTVRRKPGFRFLDLGDYYRQHAEHAEPPVEKLRQDGLFLTWDSARIATALTEEQRVQFQSELQQHNPSLYAFVPYQGSVWAEMNEAIAGQKNRNHLYPGLLIAVNRQRLADKFEIEVSRFETFSRNVLVVVHLDNAKPDQGRKTLQDDMLELAKKCADRAVQYLAQQRAFLKPAGDAPTPGQREIEKNHEDWVFNVRLHAQNSPLHLPPLAYVSPPLTEQDVVGLFHQLASLGVFPGVRVYATSQSHTYDCLLEYDCPADAQRLKYVSPEENPLGVSPYILGDRERFRTSSKTVEFKNNLDALMEELDGDTRKEFGRIDVCVCWGMIGSKFDGYEIEEIAEENIDSRGLPGVTHLLRRDRDAHVVQVVMLKKVLQLVMAGRVLLASLKSEESAEPGEAPSRLSRRKGN